MPANRSEDVDPHRTASRLAWIAQRASAAFVMRLAGATLGLLLNVAMARLLGVSGFGTYAFAVSILLMLAVVITLGTEGLVMREVAMGLARSRPDLSCGVIRSATVAVTLMGIGVIAIGFSVIAGVEFGMSKSTMFAVASALVGAPLVALTSIQQARLQGYGFVTSGYAVGFVVRPLFALILLGSIVSVAGWSPSPAEAVAIHTVGCGLALATGVLLARHFRPDILRDARSSYDWPAWSSAIPWVFFTSVLYVVQQHMDTFVLQYFLGSEGVGFYRPALQLVSIAIFASQAVNSSLQPAVAAAYSQGDLATIERLSIDSARLLTAMGSATVLGCLLFGSKMLGVFGPEFTPAFPTLMMLSLSPLVQGVLGPGWLVLAMTRRDRQVAQGFAAGGILQVVLGIILIPMLGTIGAAIAYVVGTLLRSLLFFIWIRIDLGINSAAVSFRLRKVEASREPARNGEKAQP